MGDITDWMFESGVLDMPFGDEGHDPYDYDDEGETGGVLRHRGGRSRRLPVCMRCSVTCAWVHTGHRWALQDRDGLHQCKAFKPVPASAFKPC